MSDTSTPPASVSPIPTPSTASLARAARTPPVPAVGSDAPMVRAADTLAAVAAELRG